MKEEWVLWDKEAAGGSEEFLRPATEHEKGCVGDRDNFLVLCLLSEAERYASMEEALRNRDDGDRDIPMRLSEAIARQVR